MRRGFAVTLPAQFSHTGIALAYQAAGATPSEVSRTLIVVPCYNEAHRLRSEAFVEFTEQVDDVDFLLVNDGATDDTPALLRALAERQPKRISVLDLDPNRGKAEAVRQGMLQGFASGADYVGFWDADLATPLDAIARLRGVLEANPALDMVFGSRVKLLGRTIERHATRHYLGRVFATVVSVMLRLGVYDTQCGAKLFRATDEVRSLFDEPFLTSWVFDVEIIARLVHTRGGDEVAHSIYEYPLEEWRDVAGSHVRPTDFLRAAGQVARIWRAYLR
jgi:glycosyltransferase involved in cell wall biosynthesis